MSMNNKKRRNIVVTGFGPFGIHNVNASWEAVKLLKEKSEQKLQELYNVNLIIEEIPVIYDYVLSRIPDIWKHYDPWFVVHVGVSYKAQCLTLESKAFSNGYKREDITKRCPTEGTSNCIHVGLDIDKICQKLNDNCIISISEDAGRYLCEFTFYQSLSIKPDRSLFVHVPDFNVYPSEVTQNELFNMICCTIETLNNDESTR